MKLQARCYNDNERLKNNLRNGIQCPQIWNRSTKASIRRKWEDIEAEDINDKEFLKNITHLCTIKPVEFLAVFLEYRRGENDILSLIENSDYELDEEGIFEKFEELIHYISFKIVQDNF